MSRRWLALAWVVLVACTRDGGPVAGTGSESRGASESETTQQVGETGELTL